MVEYIVAIDVTRVRFPADAFCEAVGGTHASPGRKRPALLEQLRWSSGYDARLTRERSPVQSWDEVFVLASELLQSGVKRPKKHRQGHTTCSHAGLNRGPYGY